MTRLYIENKAFKNVKWEKNQKKNLEWAVLIAYPYLFSSLTEIILKLCPHSIHKV